MALQQYEIVKTVTFSGRFPLILSDADIAGARNIIFDIFVSRSPLSPYFSSRTNPPESFYGTFTEIADDIVLERRDIKYSRQRYTYVGNGDQQIIPAMKCLYELQRVLFGAILDAVSPGFVIVEGDYLERLNNPGLFSRQFLFVCYADTALTVVVRKRKFEECFDDAVDNAPPPFIPPPPSFPAFPPGTPILGGISPDEGVNPGDYEPFPGDFPSTPPDDLFPFGDDCVAYLVTLSWNEFVQGAPSVRVTRTFSVWGTIFGVTNEPRAGSNNGSVTILCSGNITDPCTPGFNPIVGISEDVLEMIQVISIFPLV